MTPEPRLRSLNARGWRRSPFSPNGEPKNLRQNGSSKNGVPSGIGFFTVLVVKTLTTVGATRLVTGAKLEVSLVCRSRGASLTETETCGRFPPDDRSVEPLAATQAAVPPSNAANATSKPVLGVIFIICPF